MSNCNPQIVVSAPRRITIVESNRQGLPGPPGLDGTREPSTPIDVSGQLAVNQAYLTTGNSLQLLNLPAVAAIGDFLHLYSAGTGLFRVTQNAGQTIRFNADATTPGITGRVEATNINASLKLIYSGSGNWLVEQAIGNFEVV